MSQLHALSSFSMPARGRRVLAREEMHGSKRRLVLEQLMQEVERHVCR